MTHTAPAGDVMNAAALRGQAASAGRDHRADVFRGVSLLFILWNHVFWAVGIQVPLLLQFTPLHWGLASSTEAFVFLSGYVYGMVYVGVANRYGPSAVWIKSALRAWQLYVANAVTMLVSLGLVSWWAVSGPGVAEGAAVRLSLDAFLSPDVSLFWELLQLYRIPWGFDVLALYIVLLLIGPAYILLARRNVWLALFAGGALYTLAQFGVNVPAAHAQRDSWYFNPFAWQLLFLFGIVMGGRRISIPRLPVLVVAAGMIVCGVAAWVWLLPQISPHVPLDSGTVQRLLRVPVPWVDATALEPVRLLYFLILAYFVAALSQRSSPIWRSAGLRPILVAGQHSLEVFCFGLIYTYAAALVLPTLYAGPRRTAVAALAGCALSIAFAYLLRARRSTQDRLSGRSIPRTEPING
jgi:hypothetical protein